MTKHTTARFIQDEVTERLIFSDPLRLFPDGLTRRRLDTANNDISNFSFGVTADNFNSVFQAYGYSKLSLNTKHLLIAETQSYV